MILTTVLSLILLGQQALPGSHVSLQQAREEAHIIVVAEITKESVDIQILGGLWCYDGIELMPSTVLKGKLAEKKLPGVTVMAEGRQACLEHGSEYIFFVKYAGTKPGTVPIVIKMMRNTRENVRDLSPE